MSAFSNATSVTAAAATTATTASTATTATTASTASALSPTVAVVTVAPGGKNATNHAKYSRTIFSGTTINAGATDIFYIANNLGGGSDKTTLVTLVGPTRLFSDVQFSIQYVEYYFSEYGIVVKNNGAANGAVTFAINMWILD
jgi:hypothetical protein